MQKVNVFTWMVFNFRIEKKYQKIRREKNLLKKITKTNQIKKVENFLKMK